jgi:glycylpeptide N-tetradecanoyltransferase
MVHEFWDTQPIGKDAVTLDAGDAPIELPEGFEWSTCQTHELRNLLSAHYLSDEVSSLEYSKNLIEWVLHADPYWNVALRKSGKLVGFIAARPSTVSVDRARVSAVEVTFLCVSKRLRDKRLAPLLIREITRRAVLRGVHQAIYTAVSELPSPVASTYYWHRLLNVPNLIKSGFYETDRPNARMFDVHGTSALHRATQDDAAEILNVLKAEATSLRLCRDVDEDYVQRLLRLPHVFAGEGKFVCLYEVGYKSSNGVANRQAYVLHAVGEGALQDATILAKNAGFDVLNCLDAPFSEDELRERRFIRGVGALHYYLYNWKLDRPLKNTELGFVLQ